MEKIKFSKAATLFKQIDNAALVFDANVSAPVLKKIAQNDTVASLQLPLKLGEGQVAFDGDHKLQFKNNPITLSGDVASGMRFAIYTSLSDVEKDLQQLDGLKVSLPPLGADGLVYALLSFSYDIGLGGNANWIMGATSFSFGGNAERAKRMVVIKASKPSVKIRTLVQQTLELILPVNKIKEANDLSSGSITIVETDGNISTQIGAQFGYDVNWVRQTKLGGLEGDIGLNANLGASLGVGIQQSGKFAMILAKPSSKKVVHLKIHKQRKKGWNFALDLGVNVQGKLDEVFQKTSFDQFSAAVLGIHHEQLLAGLRKIDAISDPDKLQETLTGITFDKLKKITGSKVDESFDKVKTKVLNVLDKWQLLSEKAEKAGATLWNALDEHTPGELNKIKAQLESVATGNKEEVTKLLVELQSKSPLNDSTIGRLLSDLLINEDLVTTLSNTKSFKKLQAGAKAVVKVLDNKDILLKIHQFITSELSVGKIQSVVKEADVEDLDAYLKGKIGELYGKGLNELTKKGFFQKIKEVQGLLTAIYEKRNEFFEKTKRALTKKYSFQLAYNHQKIVERQAMIDVEFDFAKNPSLGRLLRSSLDGKFEKVLAKPTKGVQLNLGTLYNSVSSKSNLEINIPFLSRDVSHLNSVITSGKFLDEEDGRLMMYDLKAEDSRIRSRRMSQLAIGGLFEVKNNEVTNYLTQELQLSYSFKLAKRRLNTTDLQQLVEPFIIKYLSDAMIGDGRKVRKDNLNNWVTDMANLIDHKEENGTNNFGRTLISQNINVPVGVAKAWFEAPASFEHKKYEDVSLSIQEKIREIVPFYYFSDDSVYTKSFKREEVYAALLYASLPGQTGLLFKNNGKLKRHWNYLSHTNRRKIYGSTDTQFNLAKELGKTYALLIHSNDPKLIKEASAFKPEKVILENIIKQATKDSVIDNFMLDMFRIEEKVIDESVQAGVLLGSFKKNSAAKPAEAMKSLEAFGKQVTNAFNNFTPRVGSRKDYTRYLGPLLFIAVAKGLQPSLSVSIQGSLEIMVISKKSNFKLTTYLDNALPNQEDILLSQKIFDFD